MLKRALMHTLGIALLASTLAGCGATPKGTLPTRAGMQGYAAMSKVTGTKRALMVGVNKYDYIGRLQGCLNDIEDVKAQVLDKYGFAPANTVTLLDYDATREDILASLQKLVAESKPGDFLYFHYSGHGTQVADTNGDEVDGLDEAICPAESEYVDDVIDHVIVDDEIQSILGQLKPGVGFLFVSDSCHSGTQDERNLKARARGITLPFGTRLRTPPKANLKLMKAYKARLAEKKYTFIGGCHDDQTSSDAEINGRYNGALTYCFLNALKAGPANATYTDLVDRTSEDLKARRFRQVPSLVGAENIPFLSIAP